MRPSPARTRLFFTWRDDSQTPRPRTVLLSSIETAWCITAAVVFAGLVALGRLFPAILWGREGTLANLAPFLRRHGGRGRLVPFVVAHQSGAGEAPESTLAACLASLMEGAEWLQLDASFTRDSRVVCLSDGRDGYNLNRLTGAERPVHQLDYLDIPPLRPKLPAHVSCDPYDTVDTAHWGKAGARIARLDQVS